MGEYNIYKKIVMGAVICFLFTSLAGWMQDFSRERKTYGFILQADTDLTEDTVAEFQKILGICKFEPMQTINITLRLNQYSMETQLVGLELDSRILRWKEAEIETTIGNTPVLFFGKDTFFSFSDKNGYTPEKSQIETWIQEYRDLEITITDENGCTKKAKICGILEEPKDRIYIDKNQAQALFGVLSHTLGGYMEIHGYRNSKEAQQLLEEAGFVISESASQEQ